MTGGTTITLPGASPWAAVDVDPAQVLAEVKRRFPGVSAYFGEFTGSWWALAGEKLLEAKIPHEFIEVIGTAIESSRTCRHRPPQPTVNVAIEPKDDTAEDLLAPGQRELAAATYRPKHASGAYRPVSRQPRARWKGRGLLHRLFGGRATGQTTLGPANVRRLRSA